MRVSMSRTSPTSVVLIAIAYVGLVLVLMWVVSPAEVREDVSGLMGRVGKEAFTMSKLVLRDLDEEEEGFSASEHENEHENVLDDVRAKLDAAKADVLDEPLWRARRGEKQEVTGIEDASELAPVSSEADFPNDVILRGDGVCLRSLEEAAEAKAKAESEEDDAEDETTLEAALLRAKEIAKGLKRSDRNATDMARLVEFRNKESLYISCHGREYCSGGRAPHDPPQRA